MTVLKDYFTIDKDTLVSKAKTSLEYFIFPHLLQEKKTSLVIEFQVHSVVYLVVLQPDVVLVDGVPFLEDNLVPLGAGLGRDQLLEVSHGVVLVALDADLLPQAVVDGDLDHGDLGRVGERPQALLGGHWPFAKLIYQREFRENEAISQSRRIYLPTL